MILLFTNIFSKLKLRLVARKAPSASKPAAAAWPRGRRLALLLALFGLWLGFSFGTPSLIHAAAQDNPPSLMGGITVIPQAFPVADAGQTVTETFASTGTGTNIDPYIFNTFGDLCEYLYFSQSADFTGDGSLQTSFNTPELSGANGSTWTLEAWVKPNGFINGAVFGKRFGSTGQTSIWANLRNDGRIRFGIDRFGTGWTWLTTPLGVNAYVPNEWNHVAFVKETNQIVIFVNGVELARGTMANSPTSSNTPLRIGRDRDGGALFNGLIDNVRVSTIALNAAQLMSSMNGTLPSNNILFATDFEDAALPFQNISGSGSLNLVGTDVGISQDGVEFLFNPATSFNPAGITLTYDLSGATTGSGSGYFLSNVTFNFGITNVTWTATDGAGNSSVLNSYTLSVNNTPTPPNLISGVYQIESFENLLWISQNPSSWGANFIQTADINASPSQNNELCFSTEGWRPVGNELIPFTGNYNGNGHTISNLFINRPSEQNIGLFGYISGSASISNLGVLGEVTAGSNAGLLIGSMDGGSISQCFTQGTITAGNGRVGGLLGVAWEGSVSNSYAQVTVTGDMDNSSEGELAGGLFAQLNNGVSVANSYAAGQVSAFNSSMKNGLGNANGGTVSNSFYDGSISTTTSGAGTAKITAEMQQQATFTNWDFQCETANGTDNTWGIDEGNNYPKLSWEGFVLICPEDKCMPVAHILQQGFNWFKVLEFTQPRTCIWEVPEGVAEVEYLIVGGGGGAGSGGGGAGGFFEGTFSLNSSSYSIVVGAGGAASTDGGVRGGDGGNSNVFDISAGGGGGGGRSPLSTINGRAGLFNGGSGGGAGASTSLDGNGGNGNGSGGDGASNNRAQNRGGGGGGADGNASGFNGGNGRASSISGSSVSYAGGGASQGNSGQGTPGTGQDGPGGGGNAFSSSGFEDGKDGVVILRYETDRPSGAPIPVSTWEDLHNIRNNLNGNYILISNLDENSAGYNDYATNWEPIGSLAEPFTGTFNGLNHTIANLTISRSSTDAVGLFGYIRSLTSNVSISNLSLEDVSISGQNRVGSIAGFALNASISNVNLTGLSSISGNERVGGLIGEFNGGFLVDSFANSVVNGNTEVGGLVGAVRAGADVSRVYASGSVNGAAGSGDIGGLVGLLSDLAVVSNAYAVNNVIGPNDPANVNPLRGTGGLIGRISSEEAFVVNSYAANDTLISEGPLGGLIALNMAIPEALLINQKFGPPIPVTPDNVIDSFWDIERSGVGGINSTVDSRGGIGLTTMVMKVQNTFTNTAEDILNQAWNFTTVWDILDPDVDGGFSSYPFLRTIRPALGQEPGRQEFPFAGGSGSINDPFLIANWTHLSNIRDYPLNIYALANDIDSSLSDYATLAASTANDDLGWNPIGDSSKPFKGILDGAGFTISDFAIRRSGEDEVGLFGVLERSIYLESRIHNLKLDELTIEARNEAGTLAGVVIGLSDGEEILPFIMEDIIVSNVTLLAEQIVGGVVGKSSLSTIRNAQVQALNIDAGGVVGGIVGQVSSSLITWSYAKGEIKASMFVGGIAGSVEAASVVEESYAITRINASLGAGNIGGLAGEVSGVSRVRDSYALGSVFGPETGSTFDPSMGTGGLIGNIASTNVRVFRTYAAQDTLTAVGNLGGLIGLNAAVNGGVGTPPDAAPPFPENAFNVLDSFWDAELSEVGLPDEIVNSAGGMGKLTLKLKFLFTFTDTDQEGLDESWDFDSIWNMLVYDEPNDQFFVSYPYLRQIAPPLGEEPGLEIYYYGGGYGTPDEPFEIFNWRHLHFVGEFPESYFILTDSLDLNSRFYAEFGASGANSGEGFRPIGNSDIPFLGNFDGKGFRIRDFVINRVSQDEIGLFGRISVSSDAQAEIKNVIISHAEINGRNAVGGLVGRVVGTPALSVTINDVTIETLTISGTEQVGGLGGLVAFGTFLELITESDVDLNPTIIQAQRNVGGIFGEMNSGTLTQSYARAQISGAGLSTAGGLIGFLRGDGRAEKVFAESVINASSGEGDIGGLIGYAGGISFIMDAYSISQVTGPQDETIANRDYGTGGLIGRVQGFDVLVINTYAATPVLSAVINLGGLIGFNTEAAQKMSYEPILTSLSFDENKSGPPIPGVLDNVLNSFWDVRISGLGIENEPDFSFGGTGKSTFVMKVQSTYTDISNSDLEESWNFTPNTGVWRILNRQDDNNFISYPYLRDVDPGFENEPGRVEFPFLDGFGTVDDPFQIANWQHLWNVRLFPDLRFILNNSLDSTTSDYVGLADATADDNKGWLPIGTESLPFSGFFDGQNYEINNFVINRPNEDYVGLFGYISSSERGSAELFDFKINHVNIIGRAYTGALFGYASGFYDNQLNRVLINNVELTRDISGFNAITGTDYVGGLGGYAQAVSFDRLSANAVVKGERFVGGLTGATNGLILSESFTNASIESPTTNGPISDAGLLVGYVFGLTEVDRVFTKGSIDANGGTGNIGGFIGRAAQVANIRDVYTISSITGPTAGAPGSAIGGLIGIIENQNVKVFNAYAANATLTGSPNLGGLIGKNSASSLLDTHYANTDIFPISQSAENAISKKADASNKNEIPPFPGDFGNIYNSFWDVTISGIGVADEPTGSEGGTGKSTRQMINAVTYTNLQASVGLENEIWPFECFPASYTPEPGEPVWGISVPISIPGFDAVNDGYPHLKWEGHATTVLVNIGPVCYGSIQIAIEAINDGTETGGDIIVVVNGDQLIGADEDIAILPSGTAPVAYDSIIFEFMPSRSLTIKDGGVFTLGQNHRLRLREDVFIQNPDTRLVFETGFLLQKDDSNLPTLQLSDFGVLEIQPEVIFDVEPFFSSITTDATSFILLRNGALYRNSTAQPIQLNVERWIGRENQPANSQFGWRMLSTPIVTNYAGFFSNAVTQGYAGSTLPDQNTFSPNVIWYDETDGGTAFQSWRTPVNQVNPMTLGRGYFYYNFDGNTRPDNPSIPYNDDLPRVFNAIGAEPTIPQEGFSMPVSYTPRRTTPIDTTNTQVFINYDIAQNGWNLVGNPTASVLKWGDIDDDAWTKTRMNNSVYIWDPHSNDFMVNNGIVGSSFDGYLAPYQGFWVQAEDPNPVLSFTNDAKVIQNAEFIGGDNLLLDSDKSSPEALSFRVEAAGMITENWITFSDRGLKGYDVYDAFRLEPMANTWISAATAMKVGEPTLVINSLPSEINNVITLPYYVGAAVNGTLYDGQFTISWNIPENWRNRYEVSLMDHDRRVNIPLRSQTNYITFHRSEEDLHEGSVINTSVIGNKSSLFFETFENEFEINASLTSAKTDSHLSHNLEYSDKVRNENNQRDRRIETTNIQKPQLPSIAFGIPRGIVAYNESVDKTLANRALASTNATQSVELNNETDERPRFSIVIYPANEEQTYIPLEVELYQNYPNPFNPSTTIRFAVPDEQFVRIDIYDILGRRVYTLANATFRAGTHDLRWDARSFASGLYIIRLVSDKTVLTKTMTLVK